MARLEIGDRVRAAAMDAGILPNDPMGPVFEAVADLPAEVELRVAPVLAEMRATTAAIAAATAAIEAAASRPLITNHQIKWTLVPALLAAREVWLWIMLGVVFLAGIGAGFVIYHVYFTPPPPLPLVCEDERGGRVCYHWLVQPTEPAEEAPAHQQPSQQPLPQPKGKQH